MMREQVHLRCGGRGAYAQPVIRLCLLLCALAVLRTSGQACVAFAGSPATQGKCDFVFNTIFPNGTSVLPKAGTYAMADAAAAQQTVFANAFMPYRCRNALLALACTGNFLPNCQLTATPPYISVAPPCQSICQAVLLECTPFFTAQNQLNRLPDCNLIDNSTGTPVPAFLPDSTGRCVSMPQSMQVPYGDPDCPYPLRFNFDKEGKLANQGYQPYDQMCVMPCLSPMYSDGEYVGGFTLMVILAGISFLLCFFVVFSMCLLPDKRAYPGRLHILMNGNAVMYTCVLVFFSVISGGPQRLTCTLGSPPQQITMDNARDNDGHGVICIMQACGILFFALAASHWWLALCFNLFEMVCLQRSLQVLRRFEWIYHIFVWTISGGAVLIGLAGEQMGAPPGNKFCLFKAGNEFWSWMLLYLPTGWALLIGTTIMIIVVCRMAQIRFRVRSYGDVWEQLIRLIIFSITYWILLSWPWAYRIYTRAEEDRLRDAIQDQIECSARTASRCPLEYRYNIGTWFVTDIDMSVVGFVIFGCLCSSDVWKFWKRVIYLLRRKPFPIAMVKIRNMINGKDKSWNKRERAASSLPSASSRPQRFVPNSSTMETTLSATGDSSTLDHGDTQNGESSSGDEDGL